MIFKQLDDYRSGKRPWGVMAALAKALSAQDSADVATYFAAQAGGLPALSGNRVPESGRSLWERDPAKRLVFAGDPQRGISKRGSKYLRTLFIQAANVILMRSHNWERLSFGAWRDAWRYQSAPADCRAWQVSSIRKSSLSCSFLLVCRA